MSSHSRRTFLAGSVTAVAFAAGCLDQAGVDPASGNGQNGEDDDDDDDDEAPRATADVEGADNVPYAHTDAPRSPDADLLFEADGALGWLEERGLDDEEPLTSFVEATPFDDGVIVTLEADARNLCYEMVLEDVDLDREAGTLEVEAAVIDTSEEDDEDVACGQAEQAVGHLIQAEIGDEPEVSATIVDQDGAAHAFGFGTDRDDEGADRDDEDADRDDEDADRDDEDGDGGTSDD